MITAARLDLRANRYTPFVYSIEVFGVELTNEAVVEAQVRLVPDTPGIPVANFATAISTTTVDGEPYASMVISLSEAIMLAMPRTGELGTDTTFAWDLVITPAGGVKFVLCGGTFTVVAGVTRNG